MAECVKCNSWGKDCMEIYKAKCKECGALHCDSCFELEAEENGDWMMFECEECLTEIWRKSNE